MSGPVPLFFHLPTPFLGTPDSKHEYPITCLFLEGRHAFFIVVLFAPPPPPFPPQTPTLPLYIVESPREDEELPRSSALLLLPFDTPTCYRFRAYFCGTCLGKSFSGDGLEKFFFSFTFPTWDFFTFPSTFPLRMRSTNGSGSVSEG